MLAAPGGPAVARLAQHCAARSHICDAPFPIFHRMMLVRKQGKKTRAGQKEVPPQSYFSLWEKQMFAVCCTSTALGFRDAYAVRPHPMGMAGVALPGLSIPVPETGRISAPQRSLSKGSGCPLALQEGAVGTSPASAPCYCSEQLRTEGRRCRALLKQTNPRKRPRRRFLSNRCHAGCLAFPCPPPYYEKGKEREAESKGELGTVSWQRWDSNVLLPEDMAPAQPAWLFLAAGASGCGGIPGVPWMDVTACWAQAHPEGCPVLISADLPSVGPPWQRSGSLAPLLSPLNS